MIRDEIASQYSRRLGWLPLLQEPIEYHSRMSRALQLVQSHHTGIKIHLHTTLPALQVSFIAERPVPHNRPAKSCTFKVSADADTASLSSGIRVVIQQRARELAGCGRGRRLIFLVCKRSLRWGRLSKHREWSRIHRGLHIIGTYYSYEKRSIIMIEDTNRDLFYSFVQFPFMHYGGLTQHSEFSFVRSTSSFCNESLAHRIKLSRSKFILCKMHWN